ncbi:MAG: hypothetical protein R3338_12240 [Thermoanaerobaculia bacterium]|nr:hypothetical protein [Thermoanaerobaculia bacterium]
MDRPDRGAALVAREIVSVFPPESISRCEEFPDRIQFRVTDREGLEVRRIILGRESLRKLDRDPQRDVKIEYLRRDLENASRTRRTWAYPRALALR